MFRSTRIIAALFLVLVWPTSAHAAGVQLGRGVLVDDQQEAIVAAVPGRALTAFRIEDGKPLWRAKVDAVPVLIEGDHLVAMRDARKPGLLTLVALDRHDGTQVNQAVASLPAGVLASMGPSASSRFELRPHPEFASSRLIWSFTPAAGSEGGVRALPQSGVLRVDPATARAGALDVPLPSTDERSARLNLPFAGSNDPAFFSADRTHVVVSRRRDNAAGYMWTLYDRDARLLGRLDSRAAFAPFVVRGDVLVILHASARGWRTKRLATSELRAFDWRRGAVRWKRQLVIDQAR